MQDVVAPEVWTFLTKAIDRGATQVTRDAFAGYFKTRDEGQHLIYVQGNGRLDDMDREMVRVFSTNLAIALDNVHLNQEIVATQKEIIFRLGEVAETRSKETANHVRRVGEICRFVARTIGLSEEESELIWMASPMHDVGKVGIPDSILNKPGKLTSEEFEIMKTHAEIGYGVFKSSQRRLMKAAGIVALEHHERWNGTGYPQGLAKRDIHIYGRIAALADVFDALGHKRCYKEAWPLDRILEVVREEREKHFDPDVVDALLAHIDQLTAILAKFPD